MRHDVMVVDVFADSSREGPGAKRVVAVASFATSVRGSTALRAFGPVYCVFTSRAPVKWLEMRTKRIWLLSGLLLVASLDAFSWTRPAHMVSAAVAYDDLLVRDQQVIDEIMELMSHHPDPGPFQVAIGRATGTERTQRIFLEMARWPDDIRGGFQDHPTWHYAFRPYVDPQDPPPHKPLDVIAGSAFSALALNIEIATDPRAASSERAVALCWIFHLVGDLHQPLHTAQLFSSKYPNGDHGGSSEYVLDASTGGEPQTFHWYWDDSVHRDGEPQAVLVRARQLEEAFPRERFKELSKDPAHASDITGWAAESYLLASSFTYRVALSDERATAKPPPASYVEQMKTSAERRLTLAGYRLADLLRRIFAGPTG